MFLISFGKLDILIGIDVFISDRDGKATIYVWIKPEDQDATYEDEALYNRIIRDCINFDT